MVSQKNSILEVKGKKCHKNPVYFLNCSYIYIISLFVKIKKMKHSKGNVKNNYNSFVMTYVGVKCLTRHCSVLRDTRTRGTT